jgi:hypothetical protein
VAVRAAEAARARSRGNPVAEPEPAREARPSRPSAPRAPVAEQRPARRAAPREEPVDDEEDDVRSAFGSPDIRPAARSLSAVLPAPSDEDELEQQEEEAAPDGPYDWGVKKKQLAPGAWLLDADDTPAPETAAPAAAAPAAKNDAAAPEPDAGGGAGARGYLQRKLGQEVENLGPAIEALERRAVLTARETKAIRGRVEDTDDLDAEVSVDSFVDDRPRADADAMTPMKLVEQLRTVRRLQELLIEKGLIDPSDLERSPDE